MDLPNNPDDFAAFIQQKMKETLDQTNQVFQKNQQIIQQKTAALFGNTSSSLSAVNQEKLGQLTELVTQYPIILDPLLGYGAVLVKSISENDQAISLDPTLIMKINQFIKQTKENTNGGQPNPPNQSRT